MIIKSKISVTLTWIATILLTLAFCFPLWRIVIFMPQYPEGLRLDIYSTSIKGGAPHDLTNINIINHFIGMDPIVPDSIPELKFSGIILGLLVLVGFIAAIKKNTRFLVLFTWLLILVGIISLIDFQLWTQSFSSNLSPNAAMKIPGLKFSPKVLGVNKIHHITTIAFPHIGGVCAILSAVIASAALLLNIRKQKPQRD